MDVGLIVYTKTTKTTYQCAATACAWVQDSATTSNEMLIFFVGLTGCCDGDDRSFIVVPLYMASGVLFLVNTFHEIAAQP